MPGPGLLGVPHVATKRGSAERGRISASASCLPTREAQRRAASYFECYMGGSPAGWGRQFCGKPAFEQLFCHGSLQLHCNLKEHSCRKSAMWVSANLYSKQPPGKPDVCPRRAPCFFQAGPGMCQTGARQGQAKPRHALQGPKPCVSTPLCSQAVGSQAVVPSYMHSLPA